MSLLEIIVISVGLSLDVFAVVVCYGAVLLKVERSKLVKMILIFSLWQVGAVVGGCYIMHIPYLREAVTVMRPLWQLFTVIIFISLSIYMLYKAWRNEPILEHLSDVRAGQICIAACFTGIDAVIAGVGFGFMLTYILPVALSMLIITILVVIAGIYTGYRLGYEQKAKAYNCGGMLLVISAVNIIVKYMALSIS